MLDLGLVTAGEILQGLGQIRDRLIRYPALDAESFERRVHSFFETNDD